jgi:hypothetical protein
MLDSLKIEWLKLKNYNAFWILLGLFVTGIFGINYITYAISLKATEVTKMFGLFDFPKVWNTVGYMSSFMLAFMGLLIIMTMTGEFNFRTHRQNIIDGMSRTDFISTKMLVILALAVISTVLVFITATLLGLFAGEAYFSFKGFKYIFYFFLQALDYMGIALLLSVFVRKTGLCIAIYILYAMILENVVSLIMLKQIGSVGYYLPLESSDKLISFPVFKEVTLFKPPHIKSLLIVCAVYVVLYMFACKYRFEKSDL